MSRHSESSPTIVTDQDNITEPQFYEKVSESSLEHHFAAAKALLLKHNNGDPSLYDHLAQTLKYLLDSPTLDPYTEFEDVSKRVKEEVTKAKLRPDIETEQNEEEGMEEEELMSAAILTEIKTKVPGTVPVETGEEEPQVAEEEFGDEDVEAGFGIPNLLENMFYFKQTGVYIDEKEIYYIHFWLKKLKNEYKLSTLRFWGKIFGKVKDYYIVETMHIEDDRDEPEIEKPEEEGVVAEQEEVRDEENENAISDTAEQAMWGPYPLPEKESQIPLIPPSEASGTGVNSKSYFICTELGEPWIKLPDAKPREIAIARKLYVHFTGILDSPIISYPVFPGTEKEYLRAQIARITAAVYVAPAGYFIFDDEEGSIGSDEDQGRTNFVKNPEFEAAHPKDLVDGGLEKWVHYTQYILPQGRTTWWNPTEHDDEEVEDEDDEEGQAGPKNVYQPEVGPPLLSYLIDDAAIGNMSPWTFMYTNNTMPEYGLALVRSNIWPGAFTFSNGEKFEHIYIGWGMKHQDGNFNPPLPPEPQMEYVPKGHELEEAMDPTAEDELKAHLEAEADVSKDEDEDEEEEEEDDD